MHEMEERWNDFVEGFVELRELWEVFQGTLGEVEKCEELSVAGQKIYGISSMRARFEVALPRLIDWARRLGGIENLIIEESEEN